MSETGREVGWWAKEAMEQRARADRLGLALVRYGTHLGDCPARIDSHGRCDCGLDTILAARDS